MACVDRPDTTACTRPSSGWAIAAGLAEADQHEDRRHDQRRQHPDREEVLRTHEQGDGDADEHEAHVEQAGDPLGAGEIEHHDRERDGEPEGHDLVPGFASLFPEGASLAHAFTVGAGADTSSEPRRSRAVG